MLQRSVLDLTRYFSKKKTHGSVIPDRSQVINRERYDIQKCLGLTIVSPAGLQ